MHEVQIPPRGSRGAQRSARGTASLCSFVVPFTHTLPSIQPDASCQLTLAREPPNVVQASACYRSDEGSANMGGTSTLPGAAGHVGQRSSPGTTQRTGDTRVRSSYDHRSRNGLSTARRGSSCDNPRGKTSAPLRASTAHSRLSRIGVNQQYGASIITLACKGPRTPEFLHRRTRSFFRLSLSSLLVFGNTALHHGPRPNGLHLPPSPRCMGTVTSGS
jgi:hypothetical protein